MRADDQPEKGIEDKSLNLFFYKSSFTSPLHNFLAM